MATKLQTLVEIEGYADSLALLNAFAGDSVCPAICMNKDCEHTEEYEGDCTEGWCPECETNSMKSAMVLAGII